VDPEGNEVLIEYKPGALEVVRVTASEGAFTQQFRYDFPNRLAYYTDPDGQTFTYNISREGKLAGLKHGDQVINKTDQYETDVLSGQQMKPVTPMRYDTTNVTIPLRSLTVRAT